MSKLAAEQPPPTLSELRETKESAERLAELATALVKTMEENRVANLTELAEFGYQESQVLNMLKEYFVVILTMDRYAASSSGADKDIEAIKYEADMMIAINAALTECQPMVDIFPEQWTQVQTMLKTELLDISSNSMTPEMDEAEESEAPEEAYLKTHEPPELVAYELRIQNYVLGKGFVDRPTDMFGKSTRGRMALRASIKEVDDPLAAKRTYDIMRRTVLSRWQGAGIDKYYEGGFFRHLLKLSEAGRRWAQKQEQKYGEQEVEKFEPYHEQT
jgi:hypothetical protein